MAICAIFRDEAPYILEWVAHHRAVGIDHFFIFDNESTDGTSELLDALSTLGFLTRIPFPSEPDRAPQRPAYRQMLDTWPASVDWVAFIDADEFMAPASDSFDLKRWLHAMSEKPDIGAIALNWCIYGSSYKLAYAPRPVIERFQHRSEQAFHENQHFKSLVRRNAATGCANPHAFEMRLGFNYYHANGRKLTYNPERGFGISQEIIWDPVRLNHYVVKSRQEFFFRKRLKPSAEMLTRVKDYGYFLKHDRNEIVDLVGKPWIARTEKIKRDIARKLEGRSAVSRLLFPGRRHGVLARAERIYPELSDAQRDELATWSSSRPVRGTGTLDQWEVDGDQIRLSGWAFGVEGARIDSFAVSIDGTEIAPFTLSRIDRPDVKRHYPGVVDDSGFQIEFSRDRLAAPLADGAELRIHGRVAPDDDLALLIEHVWIEQHWKR